MENRQKNKHSLFTQIKYILDKSYRDNIPALAGQSAFFLLLSAIPLILFVFSMISLLTGKDLKAEDFAAIPVQGMVPYFDKLINYIVDSVRKATSGTAIITAIVMLWSAGKGMYCITDGILRVYRIPNNKFWLLRRIYAMGYTIVMLLILFAGLVAVLANIFLASSINQLIGGGEQIHWLTHVLLQLLFTLLQTVLMAWALKLFLRNKVERSYTTMRALIPGMLITVIAWKVLTFGVVYYLRHFAVSSVYGSLAGVFMVMIWVYFLTYLLLYGIQINFVYRHEFSSFRLFKRKVKANVEAAEKE
nr:YihY/virulence factor BrkB family protein [uncultured Ruminococcus sp.]